MFYFYNINLNNYDKLYFKFSMKNIIHLFSKITKNTFFQNI